MSQTWTLEYPQRPWTTNLERKNNRWDRASRTKEWRGAFYWLAKKERMPELEWMTVKVEPFQHGGRLQDVGACHPSVKAAIDGLVDARIVPDDSSEFLRAIEFLPPQRGRNALVIHVTGVPKGSK